MSAAATNPVSASHRPLRLRMRADLDPLQQSYLGRRYWVIKDPLTLKYYRFEEEEFAILGWLDGQTSLEQIRRRFEKTFAPQKLGIQDLHQLIGQLYRSALVISDAPGQGPQLNARRVENARRARMAALTNILSIRFRGIDPDRMLGWLQGKVGWFFSLPAVAGGLVLAVAALLLVAVEFDVFRAKLPAFQEFFAAGNWVWLAVTLALTKALHEFGHGLACKRFGGECHEMGVLLLVLTPCLYCNVSDSWMLPNKWRRAAIGAAGMYVEIVLASVCTFLWWFSQPGLLNYLCLNVMFVSSVSTLLFNANPLLRFDGYYVLSDLAEIPNLRQKASAVLRRTLASWLLGLPPSHDPFLPRRRQGLLALYTVAAAAYRWIVAFSILCFLYRVFEPYGAKIVGQMIACLALFGLVVQPLWQGFRFFHVPGRIDRVNKPRLLLTGSALAALLLAALFVPLPTYVRCGLTVRPRDAASVYADVAGTLSQIRVQPGEAVRANQPLLTLDNTDLQLAIARLEGERRQFVTRLASLRQLAFDDETALREMNQVEEAVETLDRHLATRRRDFQRLTIRAPVGGIVVPPPLVMPPAESTQRLSGWSGIPLETRNLGAQLPAGVLVCRIGDPRRLEAILAIDQADVELVRPDQRVDVFLESLPGHQAHGRIDHIAQVDMQVAPRVMSAKSGGDLPTVTDTAGQERPLHTTYQASVPLEDPRGLMLIGGRGRARIQVRGQTIARRLWRFVSRTFYFEM